MADHLDSTNLVPFKRRRQSRYHLPGMAKEAEEQIIEEVDPELRPEEQMYVRHYLSYADILLKNVRVENGLSEHETATDRGRVDEISGLNGNGFSNRNGSKKRVA